MTNFIASVKYKGGIQEDFKFHVFDLSGKRTAEEQLAYLKKNLGKMIPKDYCKKE